MFNSHRRPKEARRRDSGMTTVEKKDAALKRAKQAIDDWLHIYAADHCHEKDVIESQKRITEEGGTVAYIADVQREIREALKEGNDNG